MILCLAPHRIASGFVIQSLRTTLTPLLLLTPPPPPTVRVLSSVWSADFLEGTQGMW